MAEKKEIRTVVRNRKARHNYEVSSTLEAGIELKGSEVKSIRAGKVNLSDSYAVVERGELILKNLHINPYEMAAENPDPIRPRRLLVHSREIRKLSIQTDQRGMTLIPLSLYFKGNRVKIELGVAIGRKKYDKRQAVAKDEAAKKIKKALKHDQ